MQVDGNLNDWEGKATSYFEEQSAVIGLTNDSERLYIHFRTKDAKMAGLIRRAGLAIYVDNEGGQKKNFYVKLYDGPDMGAMRPGRDGEPERSPEDIPPEMQDRFKMMGGDSRKRMVCFVKDRITEMPIAMDGSQGPSAAYDTCWGFYSYEISIPLQESIVRYYGMNSDAGQTISIGAVWGDIDMSEMRKEMGDRPGGMGGSKPGGGGMPGGGMPGGGRPGGMEMPEKQEIWFKTTLATPTDGAQAEITEG